MKIIYGYSNCTDSTYKRIMSERGASAMTVDQKYHGLLIKGLEKNGAELYCVSGLPINRTVTRRRLVREPDEREGRAYFHYITTVNLPLLRLITVFFGSFFSVLRTAKDRDTVAVYDCLNLANAFGVQLACRMRRIPAATIVTDLPDMLRKTRIVSRVNNLLFRMADGFILLTEQMDARVNPGGKPCIVVEGHVDSEAPSPGSQTSYEEESGKRVVLYAGKLLKSYGVESLAQGFLRSRLGNAELRVYGAGEYEEELRALAREHPRIKYMGTAPNDEIVREEQRASLLVNPRPSDAEFTLYSFPSKNLEYMVSGTPVMTADLPGMPREYLPYVFLIKDETPSGLSEALESFFELPFDERRKAGLRAREFVLTRKSNVTQAKKIIDFMTEMSRDR